MQRRLDDLRQPAAVPEACETIGAGSGTKDDPWRGVRRGDRWRQGFVLCFCHDLRDQLQRRGWLPRGTDAFQIQSLALDESGNGWDGVWRVRLPVTTDFIGGTTQIIIGD